MKNYYPETILYKSLFDGEDDWKTNVNGFLSFDTTETKHSEMLSIIYRTMYSQFHNCTIMYETVDEFWIDLGYNINNNIDYLILMKKEYDFYYALLPKDLTKSSGHTYSNDDEHEETLNSKNADTPTEYDAQGTADFLDKYVNNMSNNKSSGTRNTSGNDEYTTDYFTTLKRMKQIRGNIDEEIVKIFAPMFEWFN